MTDDPVEISPQSWEYRLVAAVVYAVEQRVDGARTRWNQVVLEEEDPDFVGSAEADGSMSVSITNVLEPLRRARDLDRPLTDEEAFELREAMATLTHEAAHLLAQYGDENAPDAYLYDDAAEAFNEGRTEHWTHRNLDKIIGDVFPDAGLEHAVAAVLAQQTDDAYAAYTPAARHLDRALAKRSGLTSTQVTQTLMCADDLQRWNVAVDLLIDERLVKPGLMPEAHRDEVRKELIAPLRDSLAGLVEVEADESLGDAEKSTESAKAAKNAIAELDHELNRIERHYRVEKAQRAQQQASRPSSRRSQAVRQAQDRLPPDLRRLRAVTTGRRLPGTAGREAAIRPAAARADSRLIDRLHGVQ
ncbi:hypothetical protein [Kribbella sindirgiensis]|uniref:Uncharacterized protein n=1 Tax=Kribbella sindirgiensis TaxID=1124744 RepID=A0A4R0J6C2_9ACTN|nr:hypothetical protein [Kribbella sindirgiensis]TCC39758.1 hypothetical protein E0H50_07530 [Kribbella sindirgiensis]